jgi:hypothetical protein
MVIIPVNENISYILNIRHTIGQRLRIRELSRTNVRASLPVGIAAPVTLAARPGWRRLAPVFLPR